MAKKKAARRQTRPVQPEQPTIPEQITRGEAVAEYAAPGADGLHLCHPRSNPIRNPEALVRIDCLPHQQAAIEHQENPYIWVGLGETTLQFIVRRWQNHTGYRCEPKFYRISLSLMREQAQWASLCGADVDLT